MFRKLTFFLIGIMPDFLYNWLKNRETQGSTYHLTHPEQISEDLSEELFQEYQAHFEGDQIKYPHDQMSYNHAEFMEASRDPRLVKFLFWVNDELAGFVFLTRPGEIHLAPWVSPRFYPENAVYLPILMVTKKMRGLGHIIAFLDILTSRVMEMFPGSGCAFDMPREKRYFAKIIKRRWRNAGVSFCRVGNQEYYLGEPPR